MALREGDTALVTGGTSGIGLAVAENLAAAGNKVFLVARDGDRVADTVERLAKEDYAVAGTTCDVRDADDIRRAVAEANEFGDVDVLVNNAGRSGGGITATLSDELWDDVVATNLTSVFRMTREVLTSGMTDRGWGRVISIASTAGKQGVVYGAPYSASKHGVVGFTKALGNELAATGITVNAVCPGYVETPMAEGIRAGHAAHFGVTTDDVRRKFESKIPMGRYSTPEEVAGLVGYLTTPSANSITSQALNVCGGLGNF
jgi:ketoreductase